MPRGPLGEKRPADVIGVAVMAPESRRGDRSPKTEKNARAAARGALGAGGRFKGASKNSSRQVPTNLTR